MKAKPRALVLALVVASVGLSACGISPQADPQTVSAQEIPAGLVSPTTTTKPRAPTVYVNVYLSTRQRLTAVARGVGEPASIAGALAALQRGPTTLESQEGLESPISTAGPLTLDRQVGDAVVVGIGPSFTNLSSREQLLAVAQIVYTVTAFPSVERVQLRIGGRIAAVPLPSGALSSQWLNRVDYAALAPL